jgi:hypothetical protein
MIVAPDRRRNRFHVLLIRIYKHQYYTITPDGVVLDGESAATSFPVIVDTGTTLVYFPSDLTAVINEAFNPPSVSYQGLWINECNANPPTFALAIGGKEFTISASELLLQGELGEVKIGGHTYCVGVPNRSILQRQCTNKVQLSRFVACKPAQDLTYSEMSF